MIISAMIHPTDQISTEIMYMVLVKLSKDQLAFGHTRLVVMHPIEHHFRRAVPSRGHIAGHFGFRLTSQTKVDNFQLTVLIDDDIAWLQILLNSNIVNGKSSH